MAAVYLNRYVPEVEAAGTLTEEELGLLELQQLWVNTPGKNEPNYDSQEYARVSGLMSEARRELRPTLDKTGLETSVKSFAQRYANLERWTMVGIDPESIDGSDRHSVESAWVEASMAEESRLEAEAHARDAKTKAEAKLDELRAKHLSPQPDSTE